MRWIGQHIWDFVSRFRNDVYFENLAETAETRGLVVDADGKLSINPLSGDEHATHVYENVRNDEGSTIPVGTPVYSKGEIGGSERILVGIADASDPTKMPAIGITNTELTTTGDTKDGLITLVGIYNTNLSGFSGVSENDIVYVAIGGGLTITKPTGVNLIQNVGIVLKTNGPGTIIQGLQVTCIGRTNDVPTPLYVDHTNQRLGIGITNPSVDLHVDGDTIITGDLTVSGTTTTINTENLNVEDNNITLNYSTGDSSSTADGSGITIQDAVNSATDSTFTWSTANDRFKLSHGLEVLTGNVGIGTTSPSTRLHVSNVSSNDQLTLERTGTFTGKYTLHTANNNFYIGNTVAGNYPLAILNNGNVGIGTSSPSSTLQVGDGTTDDSFRTYYNDNTYTELKGYGVQFNRQYSYLRPTSDNDKFLYIGSTPNTWNELHLHSNKITFSDNVGEKMRINPGGNVGIGTTSPSRQLEVSNTGDAIIRIAGDSDNDAGEVGDAVLELTTDQGGHGYSIRSENIGGGTGYFKINTLIGGTESTKLLINRDGEVGIGTTSPSSTLTINQTNDNGIKLIGYDDRDDASANIYIDSGGNLKINNTNGSASGYIIIEAENYLNLKASSLVYFTSNVRVYDNNLFGIGSGNDLIIQHDGSHSYISQGGTGNLYIQQNTNDADMIFQCDDGSGGTSIYMMLDGSESRISTKVNNRFDDNVKLELGTSGDLDLLHDGSNSYIHHNGAGSLFMKADTGNIQIINYTNDADIVLQSDDGSGGVTPYLTIDGSDEKVKALKQLEVTGGLELTNGNLNMPDNSRVRLGSSTDLQLYHNGTDSVIDNITGDFYISQKAADKDLIFRADDGAGGFETYFYLDGSETKTIVSQTMEFQDNVKLAVGNSEDLTIDHNATDSRLINYTGDLRIINSANDKDITLESDDGSGGITPYLTLDGSTAKSYFSTRLGVGHTDPVASLHVYENNTATNATAGLTIEQAGTGDAIAQFLLSGIRRWVIGADNSDSDKFKIASSQDLASDAHLTIDTSGNVGVGTSSPAVKLDVVGDAQLQSAAPRLVMKETGTSKDFSLKVQTDGRFSFINDNLASEVLTIEQGGNIGIGTSNPAKKLHISDPSRVDIKFTKVGSEEHYIRKDGDYLRFRGHDDSTVLFELKNNTNGSNAASFPSGNLGIGTTSPNVPLEVNGNTRFGNSATGISFGISSTDVYQISGADVGFAGWNSLHFKADGNDGLFIEKDTNNVGVGTTSPTSKLQVDGSTFINGGILKIAKDSVTNYYEEDQMNSYGTFYNWKFAGTTVMHINSSGNVGIGTTSPQADLQVGSVTTSFYSLSTGKADFIDTDKVLSETQMGTLNVTSNSKSAGDNSGLGPSITFSQNVSQYVNGYEKVIGGIKSYITTSGNTGENSSLGFYTHNGSSLSERLTIDSSGNVGIGTSSPNNFGFLEKVLNVSAGSSSSTTLQQTGLVISGSSDANDADDFAYLSFTNHQATVSNDRVAEVRVFKNGTNVDTAEFAFYTSSGSGPAERMRIGYTGNVGIGTTSPDHLLQVESSGNAEIQAQRVGGAGVLIQSQSAVGVVGTNTNHRLDLKTNNATRATISTSGNVGIGTTNPSYKLHVAGKSYFSGGVQLDSGNEIDFGNGNQYITGVNDTSLTLGTGGSATLTATHAGNVGIGTTAPTSKLDVTGAVRALGLGSYFGNSATSYSYAVLGAFSNGVNNIPLVAKGYSGQTADLTRWVDSNNNILNVIDASGNVGIGTSSPGEKLDVDGDIKLSGDIELGHASDTTIARSAAGKVTIEGAPIQTTQMSMSHHNFYFNTTSTTIDYFVPFNSLTESSNPTITNYYGRMVAPYDGRIVKAVINTTAAIGTACSAQFWVATSAGVFAPSPAETVSNINLNTANTAATATFSGTSTAEFSEGDVVGLSIQKSGTASTAYIQVTIVWEYTV